MKEQLDNWANQNNPNNPAYRASSDNHSNQMNDEYRVHQAGHNARRRHKAYNMPVWHRIIQSMVIRKAGGNMIFNGFFDFDDNGFAFGISDNMAMDSDGDMLMRVSDNMAMDMDTGEMHIISSWLDDEF